MVRLTSSIIATLFLLCLSHKQGLAFKSFHNVPNLQVSSPLRYQNQQLLLIPSPLFHPSSKSNSVNYNNNVNKHHQKSVQLTTRQLAVRPLVDSLFAYHGNVPLIQSFGLNAVLFAVLSKKLFKMLTVPGFFHAMALGTGLWTTLGWRGWSLCVLYLFLGSTVTKVKFSEKEKRGIAEGRGGRRGPENVWGSAATALGCAICSVQGESLFGIPSNIYVLGFVASLATKLADTFASEIGKAYGKTTFLITTLERVEPGTEGAVSAEGTIAAAVGGLLLSLYGYSVGLLLNVPSIGFSTLAAFLATNAESVLGAVLQGKPGLAWVTNEVVNFINTLIGAGIAIAVGMSFL